MTNYYSIKKGLISFLKAVAITARVYPNELPKNPTYPATVVDVIDQVPVAETIEVGVVPARRSRIQIDVYSENFTQAEELQEKYFNLLSNFKGSLGVAGMKDVVIKFDRHNPDKVFIDKPVLKDVEGRSMDFMVTY
jgi:hypothetical protein